MNTDNVIYCFTNDINGKQYIGLTTNLKKRIGQHLTDKRKYHFHHAIKKYGWQHFHLSILEIVHCRELLQEREIHWISKLDTYNNGYNSTQGGNYGVVPPVVIRCKYCNRTFEVQQYRKDKAHFCGYECRNASYGKEYIIQTPECEIISIINLAQFSRNNNLMLKHMHYVLSGKRVHHKGYRVFKIPCILYKEK